MSAVQGLFTPPPPTMTEEYFADFKESEDRWMTVTNIHIDEVTDGSIGFHATNTRSASDPCPIVYRRFLNSPKFSFACNASNGKVHKFEMTAKNMVSSEVIAFHAYPKSALKDPIKQAIGVEKLAQIIFDYL